MSISNPLYYEAVQKALEKRAFFELEGKRVGLKQIREIYTYEGIHIIQWEKKFKKLRAVYVSSEDGTDVLINKNLLDESKLFSLAHELKHHYLDSERLKYLMCSNAYDHEPVYEIAAAIFAGELLWPEIQSKKNFAEFDIRIGHCTAEKIIIMKNTLKLPISYEAIVKRLEIYRMIEKGSYKQVHFRKIEATIYPNPYNKRFC